MNEAQNNSTQAQTGKKVKVPKAFAAVYYPVIVLVAVALLICSFISYYYAGASTSSSVDAQAAYDRYAAALVGERNAVSYPSGDTTRTTADVAAGVIRSMLGDMGIAEGRIAKVDANATKSSVYQKITADFVTEGGGRVPTYAFMDMSADGIDFVVDRDTVTDMTLGDSAGNEGIVYTRQVKDFVIALPGNGESNDAVILMTHYDSDAGSDGASSAAAVAAMLATVDALKNAELENDVVFVLTDGRYEDSVGAYAFKNQFEGFDNVWDRAKAVFNFDAITAGGALTVWQTSENDGGVMGGYIASDASVRFDSSVAALATLEDGNYTSDFNIVYNETEEVWEKAGINFVMTAGAYDAGGKADTTDNVSADVVGQYASAMESLALYFGNADLSALGAGLDVSAYTYLGMNGAVSGGWVYVMAAILLVLLAGNLFLAAKKKTFGLESAFKGLGGVLLALILSLAAFLIAYFIIGLLTVAFGAATMNMLVSAHILTPAVLIPAILFALAVGCGLYPLVKRMFKIKAADCVRGGAILQMAFAAIFAFIVPTAALPFLIVGLLNAFVMMASSLLKAPFAKKFGFGIERLFLYTIPAMIGIPFLVQATLTIGNMFSLVALPFLLVAFAMLFTSVAPYFDYLRPAMADAYDKLPRHTIRVVETVVEDREDEVKKGKFHSVSETKVVNRKVPWRYHNWFGVTVLCVITVVAMLIAAPVSANANAVFGQNVTTDFDYTNTQIRDTYYDDAVVCYVSTEYSDVTRYSWLIRDEAVYKEIRGLDGYDYYEWTYDSTLQAYRLDVTAENQALPSHEAEMLTKNTTDDGCEIVVNPTYDKDSQVILTLTGLSANSTISIEDPNGSGDTLFSITLDAPASSVDVVLPYGIGACTVEISASSVSGVSASGYEYATSRSATLFLNAAQTAWNDIQTYFADRGRDVTVSFVLYDRT